MPSGRQKGEHDDSSAVQQSMFEASGDDSGASSARKPKQSPVHLKSTRSLERLRDRIDLAVKELHRLRASNLELQKKLDAFRAQGIEADGGTSVIFTESPEMLRARVEKLISTIDHYLDTETEATESSGQRSHSDAE